MNKQKMREAFEAWVRRNLTEVNDQSFKRMPVLEHLYENGHMEALWQCYQAATAATQRDAMAVAEAVHQATCEEAGKSFGAERMRQLDLAAIVEAVRPGQQEVVNQQMLAALKRYDIEVEGTQIYRVGSPDGRYVLFDDVAAIAAAEAAQPASAQQQGEPVAWYRWSEMFKKRLFTDVTPTEELAWVPLYTAPSAPACSVPDVDVFAKVVGDFEACGETDTSQDELMQFANHGWLECTHFEVTDNGRAMLAAAPKGGA